MEQLVSHLDMEDSHSSDLENALIRLEEEQQRSASLAQVSAMLREELDQANTANQALSKDIRKLTAGWAKAREELQLREAEWRREKESLSTHLSREPSRLLALWRQALDLRRCFGEARALTERDLSELLQLSHTVQAAYLNLPHSESSPSAALGRQSLRMAQLEEQLKDKVRDMIQLQIRCDMEKAELRSRVWEVTSSLECLKGKNLEKGRTIEALTQKLEALLEGEKACLLDEKQEKASVQEERVHLVQERLDLDSEPPGLGRSLPPVEPRQEALEQELLVLQREKERLQEQLVQLSRQRDTSSEELGQARQELQRQRESLLQVAQEKESLAQEKAGLLIQLAALERENRGLAEELACLRVGRDALETTLYETQQHLAQVDLRREQLEADSQDLLLAKEALQVEASALRKQMAAAVSRLEREKELAVQNHILAGQEAQATQRSLLAAQEEVEHLQQEKEALWRELEAEREQLLQEREELLARQEAEKEELRAKVVALHQAREESRLQAEKEKQQGATLALNAELQNLHSQLEEALAGHEQEVKVLHTQAGDLAKGRRLALTEAEELKSQLRLLEEAHRLVRQEVAEAHRKMREAQEAHDLQRKVVAELWRSLNDECKEKEVLQRSNAELRAALKQAETERISLKRQTEEKDQKAALLEEARAAVEKEAADLRGSLREVEQSRLEARRELQELRRQAKMLDGENLKKSKEVVELQARVALEEQREEESQLESLGLKQKILESEASQELAQKELRHLHWKLLHFEGEARRRERGLLGSLEDARVNEKKMRDDSHNLEIKLEEAQAERTELGLQLSAAEGRIQGLEEELLRVEELKRESEFKLGSLHSALRRTLVVGHRSQALSPACSASPQTGNFSMERPSSQAGPPASFPLSPEPPPLPSHGEQLVADVDLEVVHVVLRDFLVVRQEREELGRVTASGTKLETETGRLEAALDASELLRQSLEGDLWWRKVVLRDREAEIQLLQRQVMEREKRASTLQHSLDRLSLSLAKAAVAENSLKEEVRGLRASLSESQENRLQLQKALSANEDDRRDWQGRLDAARQALSEAKKLNKLLSERLSFSTGQQQELELKEEELEELQREQQAGCSALALQSRQQVQEDQGLLSSL